MYDNIEFIIACGGKSTRNFPHSKAVAHKSLMPFGDVRLIDVVLKDIIDLGAKHITLVCSSDEVIKEFKEALAPDTKTEEKLRKAGRVQIADALKSTFLPGDIDLKYVVQSEPLGTAHVLGLAHRVSPDRHGVLIFPDDIIMAKKMGDRSFLSRMVEDFAKDEKQISLTGVVKDDVSNNAIIVEGRLVEKPKNPTSNVAGYSPIIFPKEIMDLATKKTDDFERTGKLDVSSAIAGEWIYTDLVNEFLDKNDPNGKEYKLKMFIMDPNLYMLLDTGSLPLYEKCQLYALLERSMFKADNIAYAKELLKDK